MKLNKIKLLLTLSLLLFCLTGCNETSSVNINVENSEELNNTVLGINALIEIGNGLYYDSTTRIVYWWNGCLSYTNCSIAPTPYYAPNGLPYRYNPETNTFEEISQSEKIQEASEKRL